mgnify:CR=1 FL=1
MTGVQTCALPISQMAETERKAKEAQAKMQMQQQGEQQKFQLEIAKLQQQVAELTAKYQTQSNIDAQRNATDIALANINNASKERIAEIAKGMEFDQFQMQLEHEQNINAMEAIRAAEGDIRQHGLAIEQQAFQQQAEQVKKQIKEEPTGVISETEKEFVPVGGRLINKADVDKLAKQSATALEQNLREQEVLKDKQLRREAREEKFKEPPTQTLSAKLVGLGGISKDQKLDITNESGKIEGYNHIFREIGRAHV